MPGARADGSIPTASEKGRARRILNRLKLRYPEIGTALDYESRGQLLVVTVLSAQTTDDNVNRVAPALFARYPTPFALAEAKSVDVEQLVFSTGFYRQKTRAIIELSQDIVEGHEGVVPADLDELVKLRGVGRKTASVVLAEVWGVPAIAVDTHVKRVSGRLGLTQNKDATKIEFDLKAVFPRAEWKGISMRMIQFGRDVCDAQRPRCGECELFSVCRWPERFERAGRKAPV